MERYPSLAALELFDVVRAEERDAFERLMTAQLGYRFQFREPSSVPPHQMVVAQRRDRHVVLTRLLPLHSQLQGLDLTHLTQMPASLKGRGRGDLTPAFERVVMRCLAKNPDDRYQSAAQLMRALAELDLPAWTQAEAASFWADHAAAEDAKAERRPPANGAERS